MKLLFCPTCRTIINIVADEKTQCRCGKSWGRYINNIEAEFNKHAVPIGFNNKSFRSAYMYKDDSILNRFIAFFINNKADNVKIVP